MESSTTHFIVESLTRAIVEHRLQPGTKLAEQKLADHFGVSRTLVRQALFQLAQILRDLVSRSSLITLMYQRSGAARHSQEEHVEIVKALAAKDEARAVRLMNEHLLHVEQSLAFDRKVPTHDIAVALS